MKIRALLITLALCIFPAGAFGDEPSPAPATTRVLSPNGTITAISEPGDGTRIIESASGKEIWEMPGWYRSIFISNDGEHLAIGYSGMNLVPLETPDSLELIGFWERGRKVKSLSLQAIVPDRSILQRTASHYAWGNVRGIDSDNCLVVERVDGEVFRFNMVNGEAK